MCTLSVGNWLTQCYMARKAMNFLPGMTDHDINKQKVFFQNNTLMLMCMENFSIWKTKLPLLIGTGQTRRGSNQTADHLLDSFITRNAKLPFRAREEDRSCSSPDVLWRVQNPDWQTLSILLCPCGVFQTNWDSLWPAVSRNRSSRPHLSTVSLWPRCPVLSPREQSYGSLSKETVWRGKLCCST